MPQNAPECTSEHLKSPKFSGEHAPRPPRVNSRRVAMFSTSANDIAPPPRWKTLCTALVGVVGVDPESVGRQTTSKVVNQSSSEWNKRDVAKSKVRPCFLLFSTKKALSKVLYLILPLVLHTFYCMPLVARLCHSVALLT